MLRIKADKVYADLTGVHPMAGEVRRVGSGTQHVTVELPIPVYTLGTVEYDGDKHGGWAGQHHAEPLVLKLSPGALIDICENTLAQLAALGFTSSPGRDAGFVPGPPREVDHMEDLRQSVAQLHKLAEHAATLLGPIWVEREGLRRPDPTKPGRAH